MSVKVFGDFLGILPLDSLPLKDCILHALRDSPVGDMDPYGMVLVVIFSKGAEPDTVEFLWNVAESLK